MAKYYFVRHGEANIEEQNKKIYKDRGQDMITLSKKGIEQIKESSKDKRLENAQIIITSPFGRALHTASILSKELGIDIVVETDLHEWQPDNNYEFLSNEDAMNSFMEFVENHGVIKNKRKYNWESVDEITERIKSVLNKYKNYDSVIVVCHGVVMQCFLGIDNPKNGQIEELEIN